MRVLGLVLPVVALGGRVAVKKNAALEKVVEMLKGMKTKALEEKQLEEVAFSKWSSFMDSSIADAQQTIEDKTSAKNEAIATIQMQSLISEQSAKAMAGAEDQIRKIKEDRAAAKRTRGEEKEAYVVERTELMDGVYACTKAKETLAAVSGNTEAGAASFVQLHAAVKALKGDGVAKALLAQVEALSDPLTVAHESKVGVVIEMVGQLQSEFEEAEKDATTAENNRQQAFELEVTAMGTEQKNEEDLLKSKTEEKGTADESVGKASEEEAAAEAQLVSTKKYKLELEANLALKTKEYTARMQSRVDEQTALTEALTVLEGSEMQMGGANLDSAQSVGSLIQLSARKDVPSSEKVVAFLRSKAASLNSKLLMQLADSASADPFAKVMKMIQDLVARLEEEASAESSKHEMCSSEMAENDANIKKDNEDIEKHTARKDKAEGRIAEESENKKNLETSIKKLQDDMSTAKALRIDESAENARVKAESEGAIGALENATTVLKAYYDKVNPSFLQQDPAYAGGEYSGVGGEGGIMGLLDVIKSDMTKLLDETVATEAADSTSHAEYVGDTETEISTQEATLRKTEEMLATETGNLDSANEDLTDAEKSLSNNTDMKRVTDDKCIAKGMSFEEKTEKRDAEIQSLREALEILTNM